MPLSEGRSLHHYSDTLMSFRNFTTHDLSVLYVRRPRKKAQNILYAGYALVLEYIQFHSLAIQQFACSLHNFQTYLITLMYTLT